MSQALTDFVEFFGIDMLFQNTVTVQVLLTLIITSFIGCIITVAGIRCIFELIKILTDWSKFK